MWYDNFKVGDTIRYNLNAYGRFTGETKDFVLTSEMLHFITQYEDESNYHGMRVVKQGQEVENNTTPEKLLTDKPASLTMEGVIDKLEELVELYNKKPNYGTIDLDMFNEHFGNLIKDIKLGINK